MYSTMCLKLEAGEISWLFRKLEFMDISKQEWHKGSADGAKAHLIFGKLCHIQQVTKVHERSPVYKVKVL